MAKGQLDLLYPFGQSLMTLEKRKRQEDCCESGVFGKVCVSPLSCSDRVLFGRPFHFRRGMTDPADLGILDTAFRLVCTVNILGLFDHTEMSLDSESPVLKTKKGMLATQYR